MHDEIFPGSPSEQQIEAFREFIRLFPRTEDLDLIILKSHLLVEQQVDAVIRARLPNAELLLEDGSHLTSANRARIARATFPPGHEPLTWSAVNKLNRLRNRVAHSLEQQERDKLVTELIESLTPGDPRGLIPRFEYAIWILFAAVSCFASPLDEDDKDYFDLPE